tara:strand:+ start:97 stop:495 length:399 start_codon:yes stop_codon:yes gene_type:complete
MSSKGSAIGISPKLPLSISSRDGAYRLNKTFASNAQQNLKNLILTSPGERIMDPEFGVGIRNYLFENFNDIVQIIPGHIEDQVGKYMPYIGIEDILIQEGNPQGGAEHTLFIQIFYRIPSNNASQLLSLNLS